MRKQMCIIILLALLSGNIFGDVPGFNEANKNKSPDELWQIFLDIPDSQAKADMIIALAMREKGNRNITDKINNYLMGLNNSFRSGKYVDYQLVSSTITAVMELDNVSSYPVLLAVLNTGYPEVIAYEAYGALDAINGNLYPFLADIIEKNSPQEKYFALKTGTYSKRMSISQRGRLATLALEKVFDADGRNAVYDALRYTAVVEIGSLGWTNASTLAVRSYYRVNEDFLKNAAPKDRLIEAITCLGAAGDKDAALALALRLGLINSEVEKTGVFDPEITLALITALGRIGASASFDHLFRVTHLSYPDYLKIAAREALDRLKW